ncbi:structure-specific endonuclease subunit slx1 [Senna tora]|uniref:Structure-specific endonuclease subunit slx1 n=1 Tax=Senna tora TaxID=362788 RepID=A0A834WJ28_9FABA|nr:structure-specific endonuclease subunit slx1 [Senna tora]
MMRTLSSTFPSVKRSFPNPNLPKLSSPPPSYANSSAKSKSGSWCVYLILATNHPIKTYVGVTTNFSRRLKEHNGELRGGAKASRAGRPWVCACLIRGFTDRSEACVFESKWKAFSRRGTRKKQDEEVDDPSLALLQHRQAALNKVRASLDCNHLKFKWHLNPL